MITYWILIFIIGVLSGLISPLLLLPNATLSSGVAGAFAQAGVYIALFNQLLPNTMAALAVIIPLFVAVEAAIFGYKLVMWVVKKFPGIS